MEQEDAQGVDVGLRACGSSPEEFGGHERRRPGQRRARLSQVVEPAHQAEIGQLGPAVRSQEDVCRLDVAVDQSRIVGGAQGEHDFSGKLRGPARLEGALAYQGFAQREPARDILHLDEVEAFDAAEVVDRDDVRVEQVGGRSGLGPELLADLRLLHNQPGIHHFQGTVTSQTQMPGLENTGHRALAQHRLHSILAHSPADQRVDVITSRSFLLWPRT